jgi:tetratricopeptide (TPR) repeat protein
MSWAQTGYWEDSVSVARHAIAVTGDNAVMEHDLAYALALEGRRGEAIAHYARSLTLAPDNYAGQYDLGKALVEDGRPDEAAAHFRASVRLKPDYAEAHFALATVLARQNDSAGAAREFEMALAGSLSDEYAATAHNDLGVILGQQGRFAEAGTHFAAAARLKPDLIAAHVNYARALAAQNKSEEARAWLTEVLRRNGENAELRAMLNSLAK